MGTACNGDVFPAEFPEIVVGVWIQENPIPQNPYN
jgi:hypothetical protein